MKMTEVDFEALVDMAMRDPHVAQMGPVIRKELLHYDILLCLNRSGMLDDLVFQGGTSKEPAVLRQEPDYAMLKVDKWQISMVTSPGRRDLPRQRIKIEVANIPAYTREVLP